MSKTKQAPKASTKAPKAGKVAGKITPKVVQEAPAPTEAPATTEASTTNATPAGPTKAEQLATKRAEARATKEAARAARKAATAEKRANGVIGTLKQALEAGTTKKEVLATLTAKFPDRDPIGMATTVGIQLSRLPKSTGREITSVVEEGRGRVYRWVVARAPEAQA